MISTARGDDAQTARALVHSVFEARYHDLTRLLSLASAAVAFAEERAGGLPAEVVASAWMQYGNALRILGRHEAAERALERPERCRWRLCRRGWSFWRSGRPCTGPRGPWTTQCAV